MWIALFAAIIITILIFSVKGNRNIPWKSKEDESVSNDPGSDD